MPNKRIVAFPQCNLFNICDFALTCVDEQCYQNSLLPQKLQQEYYNAGNSTMLARSANMASATRACDVTV
jgi:hypothetical protein